MSKTRLATVWLDGCSGCHMSLLDMDERLIDLLGAVDLVCCPLVDTKEFPENVDVALVEGAVSSDEDLEKIKKIRERSKVLVSLGDCAINSNIPGMRNPHGVANVMQRAYVENVDLEPQLPSEYVPKLLARVRPIHEVVKVDAFIQGCPPSADTIFTAVSELLEGKKPEIIALTRFGA